MCVTFVIVAAATKSTVVAGIGAVLIFLSYAYSPRGYAIFERSIVVKRLIGSVRIPLGGIREVRKATADDLRGCIKLWGSGGLFGYYGLFRTSKLGKSTWYVTNRGNAVVVTTDAVTTVVSPDSVDAFITAIHSSVPVPPTALSDSLRESMRSHGSRSIIGKSIGAGIGVVVIAFIVFAILYAPGPPKYTLTPQALTIHDRFYPVTVSAASVDVEHGRIVDLGADTEWRPTARTNGFANSHYRSGWFRVANGKTVRMYRADSRRLVLLPPKGDGVPILLEVSQPERFVEEVRREWSPR